MINGMDIISSDEKVGIESNASIKVDGGGRLRSNVAVVKPERSRKSGRRSSQFKTFVRWQAI